MQLHVADLSQEAFASRIFLYGQNCGYISLRCRFIGTLLLLLVVGERLGLVRGPGSSHARCFGSQDCVRTGWVLGGLVGGHR